MCISKLFLRQYRKFKPTFFLLSLCLLPGLSYAGEDLYTKCERYPGTHHTWQAIGGYNAPTFNAQSQYKGINVRFKHNSNWYHLAYDQQSFKYFFDMIKVASLTGKLLHACTNENGGYLLGLEWPISNV